MGRFAANSVTALWSFVQPPDVQGFPRIFLSSILGDAIRKLPGLPSADMSIPVGLAPRCSEGPVQRPPSVLWRAPRLLNAFCRE